MCLTFSSLCRLGLLLPFSLLFLTGCGHGPKVVHGNIEVFYTDGATKADADLLAAYFSKQIQGGGTRSMQLKKPKDTYQFRMVIKKELQSDDNFLLALEFEAARVSRDLFGGAAVEMHACDERLNTIKLMPPRADIRYGIIDRGIEVFFSTPADKEDALRLAKYYVEVFNAKNAMTLKLARRPDVIEVHMVVLKGIEQDEGKIPALEQDTRRISAGVFNGAAIELHLCDERLRVLRVIIPKH